MGTDRLRRGQGRRSAADLAGAGRGLIAAPYAPAATAALLAVLAAVQAPSLASSTLTVGGLATNVQLALALLSLIATLPLAVLRSHPVLAALVMAAANTLSMLVLHGLTVASAVAQLIVLYALGRSGRQLLAGLLAVPYLACALAAPSTHLASVTWVTTVLLAATGLMAAWAGSARRAQRAAAELSQAQAGIAGTLLEHTARGERARISRELHDVVAHHISMIVVQAETARLTTPGLPADGAQQLSSIGDTARAALTEMRRLLGVLREDTSDVPAERQPQPGIYQLTELIDAARDVSDASTRLIISGWPELLDPGVELAAYRIVQEALTNARRHAAGAAVDVELHFGPDTLALRIRDNGPGPPAGLRAGNGLLGMRERAAAVGGRLQTGADAGGGFMVEAWLPAKAESQAAR